MLNRFSSLRTLKSYQSLASRSKTTTLYPYPIPKTYITATIDIEDYIPPKGRNIRHTIKDKKKETFGHQLFKKHQEKAKHLIKEFIHLVVHGSKSAYKDAKYLASVVSSKPKKDYTVDEIREVNRIRRDLTKFVPFYAALIIPAGELALFPYLYLFPRAVPSYFMNEKAMKEEKYRYIDNQARAQDNLREQLLSVLKKAGYNAEQGESKDIQGMKKFFLENKETLLPLLNIKNMGSEALKNASDFLMFEYIEGTYILNLLYKTTVNLPRYGVNMAMWIARNSYRAIWTHPIFNYSFKMNTFPFEGAKQTLLRYQFEKQLNQMKAQNYALMMNQFGDLNEEAMLNLAKQRGYNTNKEEDAKKWLKEEWSPVVKDNLNDQIYMFWYSVLVSQSHH